jgi:DNA-binding transcriptional ArsR family regulator
MSDETIKLLKEISNKLDQLIILGKLTNKNVLDSYQKEIKDDPIYSKLVEYADGTLPSSELAKKVAEETSSAEITVKVRLAKLREMGFLIARREGREVFYEKSGLFE